MKTKRTIVTLALAAMTASANLQAEDAPAFVSLKRLSLETAEKIAQGAIQACRKQGIQINAPTSALSDRANTPIGRLDGLVMSAGGLPIQAGGQLLGGVGVSGAPAGETDEGCAQAGIDQVIDDLEMGM
jgi:uncharacterized protein GlcG (DUF336 family)